jgi:hypothetical protein
MPCPHCRMALPQTALKSIAGTTRHHHKSQRQSRTLLRRFRNQNPAQCEWSAPRSSENDGGGNCVRRGMEHTQPQTQARLARVDPELLCPVKHRGVKIFCQRAFRGPAPQLSQRTFSGRIFTKKTNFQH